MSLVSWIIVGAACCLFVSFWPILRWLHVREILQFYILIQYRKQVSKNLSRTVSQPENSKY